MFQMTMPVQAPREPSSLQVVPKEGSVSLQLDRRVDLSRSILLLDGRTLESLDFELTPGFHQLSYELLDDRNQIVESAETLVETAGSAREEPDKIFRLDTAGSWPAPAGPEEEKCFSLATLQQSQLPAQTDEKVFSMDVFTGQTAPSSGQSSSAPAPSKPVSDPDFEANPDPAKEQNPDLLPADGSMEQLILKEEDREGILMIRHDEELEVLQPGAEQTALFVPAKSEVTLLQPGGSGTLLKARAQAPLTGSTHTPPLTNPDLNSLPGLAPDLTPQPDLPPGLEEGSGSSTDPVHSLSPVSNPDADRSGLPASADSPSGRDSALPAAPSLSNHLLDEGRPSSPANTPDSLKKTAVNGQPRPEDRAEGPASQNPAAQPLSAVPLPEPASSSHGAVAAAFPVSASGPLQQPAGSSKSILNAGDDVRLQTLATSLTQTGSVSMRTVQKSGSASSLVHPVQEGLASADDSASQRSLADNLSSLSGSKGFEAKEAGGSGFREDLQPLAANFGKDRQTLFKSALTKKKDSVQAVLKTGRREFQTGNQLFLKDPSQAEIQVHNGTLRSLCVRSRTTDQTYSDLKSAMESEKTAVFDIEASIESASRKQETHRWTVVSAGEPLSRSLALSAGQIDLFYSLDENGQLSSWQQTQTKAPLLCRGFEPVDKSRLSPGESLRLYVDSTPGIYQMVINGKEAVQSVKKDELGQPYLPVKLSHGPTHIQVRRSGQTICSETLRPASPFGSLALGWSGIGLTVGALMEYRRRRFA